MKKTKFGFDAERLVFTGLMTAIIVVLQIMAVFTRTFLPIFALNLALIPIVIGAARGGSIAGAWLGFASGLAVLISGDAAAFMAFNPFGTIVTVLAKGALSGLCGALVYKLIEKKNKYIGVVAAAIVTPVVNTGIFLLGCLAFFMPLIREWAGEGNSAMEYIFIGLIGVNFLIEIAINLVLCPTAIKLLNIKKK